MIKWLFGVILLSMSCFGVIVGVWYLLDNLPAIVALVFAAMVCAVYIDREFGIMD